MSITKKLSRAVAVSALASVVALTACGGGGGKISVKSNEFIGAIPSIVANYNSASDALREKKKTNPKLSEKYQADMKAEWAKVKGKDLPFTMDDKFKALKMEVKSVKVDGDKGGFSVNLVATQDLNINYMNNSKYGYITGNFLAKDGSVIAEHRFFVGVFMTQTNIKAGQPMYHDGGEVPSGAINYNEKWADLASIQFVVSE